MGASGAGHTAKLLEQLPQRDQPGRDRRGDGRRAKAGLDLRTFLDVLNNSSGVNFATLNRFPHDHRG